MKTHEFITVLQQNPSKELLFEYQPNQFIQANYHVTEIKNVQFDTTDCGGKTNHWKETQIQLWEKDSESIKTNFLTTSKVFSILNRVNSITPLWLDTELKIEYGNKHFHTSVMKIKSYKSNKNQVVISLFEEKTQCKAIEDSNQVCC